jgi:rhamnose utilization protein RhaD (predicted bifunctional aldolase and dehydrogenase)
MADSKFSFSKSSEFQKFCELSAELGRNPLLVQGAGGNTSIKEEGMLWVKASGTWLSEATEKLTMVAVSLARLEEAMAQDDERAEKPQHFTIDSSSSLRPSIETVVHASLKHRVVLHVHCVETISWAVLTNAEDLLSEPLACLDWAFIPYNRPGLPLARAIQSRITDQTNILILGNHGLVVAEDSLTKAKKLLLEVHQRLQRSKRDVAIPQSNFAMSEESNYRLANNFAQGIAHDPSSLRAVKNGSLYPDHVIFLGSGLKILKSGKSLDQFEKDQSENLPKALIVPNQAVLVHKQAARGTDEMLMSLTEVAARLQPQDNVSKLGFENEAALLNWDAEKYRQELARRSATA